MSDETVFLNVRISSLLKKQAKIRSINLGKSLTEYLIDLIKRDLRHGELFTGGRGY